MKSTEKGMLEKSFGWVWLMVKRLFYLSQNQTNSRSTWWRRSLCQLHRQPLLLLCRILMVQVYPNHLILQQGFLQEERSWDFSTYTFGSCHPSPNFWDSSTYTSGSWNPFPKASTAGASSWHPSPKHTAIKCEKTSRVYLWWWVLLEDTWTWRILREHFCPQKKGPPWFSYSKLW